jgi:hypothetical protein
MSDCISVQQQIAALKTKQKSNKRKKNGGQRDGQGLLACRGPHFILVRDHNTCGGGVARDRPRCPS